MHLDGPPRPCPVCGSINAEASVRKASLTLLQCLGCRMFFSSTLPPEFSDATFYKEQGSAFYSSADKLAGDYSPVRYKREIKALRRHLPRGSVLDVGCSTGGFLYYLNQSFPGDYEILGTDVASGALDIAESKAIPVSRESFLEMSRPEKGWDAITFWAVLEHLAEPAAFLRKARDLLAENGRCFILVPNIESLAVRILGAKYRYILPQHLNYFSRSKLQDLALRSGLCPITTRTTHFNPAVIYQDLKSKEGLVADEDRAALLLKTNRLKSNPLLFPLRWSYSSLEQLLNIFYLGDNVLLICRK